MNLIMKTFNILNKMIVDVSTLLLYLLLLYQIYYIIMICLLYIKYSLEITIEKQNWLNVKFYQYIIN